MNDRQPQPGDSEVEGPARRSPRQEPGGRSPFAAPWEARAFALAVALRDAGRLPWPEFQRRLADRVAADPDDATPFYEHWLAALEASVAEGAVGPQPGRPVPAGG